MPQGYTPVNIIQNNKKNWHDLTSKKARQETPNSVGGIGE